MASQVHETAFVGPGVELGEGVTIGPFASVTGPCTIGAGTWIGPGARIGGPPEISSLRQNAAWDGDLDHAGVVIGADVVIRENVVIHQGSWRPTTVGDGAWLLNSVYLAHDVQVGAGTTVSAGVSIGGHAEVGPRANLGMNAAVHQGRKIGAGAMVGMATPVSRDVPPFTKVYGAPPRLAAINVVVLTRMGAPAELADDLLQHYTTGATLPDVSEWDAVAEALAWWAAQDDLRPVRPVETVPPTSHASR